MRRFIPALVAAVFAAVTFSAYAIDQGTQGNPPAPTKQSKKKKKAKAPAVGQSANPMDKSGQGAAQSSGKGGVQAGAPAAQGRGDPTGAPAAGGGAVTSPTPQGAGRANNQ
jgi:hypothetical protein